MIFLMVASVLWAAREPIDYGEELVQRAIIQIDGFFAQNKVTEALRYGDRFAEEVRESSSLFYALGLRCNQRDRLDDALRYYGKALQRSPDMVEALYDRSEIFLAQGNWSAAEKDLRKAQKTAKEHWVIHVRLAEIAGHKKNKKQLDQELRKAVQLGFKLEQLPTLGAHWKQWAHDKKLERTLRQIISQYGDEDIWLQLIRY